MSNIDKQALRQIAESIDREEWDVLDNGDADYQVIVSRSLERGATYRSYQPVTNEISNKKIAAFIAAFNPKVALALLDELEATAHSAAVDHEAACSLVEENEELKRRIAELEAREISLPERSSMLYRTDFHEDYHTVMAYKVSDVIAAIRAAGIGVKYQEDSVDSDVSSRNQPGMVVAVHIDAGDFVKVKGQVFEVEETDFDDHDVTLWFVGGNALKCAAGCPVEVVSAPVAAGIKVKGERDG
ncbi:ead/Ea22-like family protein [Salmonella enterica]|nr:ead/Ea22-like family protein [Salmonella enterica]